MLKRILVTFENLSEAEQLLDYAELLSKNYDTQIVGAYIKDIRKYEVVPPMAEGMIIDSTNGFAMREWEAIEEKRAQEIKRAFLEKMPLGRFIIEEGIGLECIVEKMRAFDLLVMAKGEYLNSNLKNVLKFHMKPIIIVPKAKEYSFDKIVLLDDGGIRANSALGSFINIFDKSKKIDSLTFGKSTEDDYLLKEYYNSKGLEITKYFEDNFEDFSKYEKTPGLFIMGNLRYNFLLEKLTGKFGVKILETCNMPIFIG